jgi:hypothetical protein
MEGEPAQGTHGVVVGACTVLLFQVHGRGTCTRKALHKERTVLWWERAWCCCGSFAVGLMTVIRYEDLKECRHVEA